MPPWPMTETRRALLLALGRVEQLLEQAQFVVAPGEGRLERLAPARPAAQPDHGRGTPRRDRRGLALEQLLAGFLEADRALGGVVGRLTDQHRARRRDATGAGWRC